MIKYLKEFKTHVEYEQYVTGGTMARPNVSYCDDEKDVHFNPIQYICKLILNDGTIVNIEGNGELTSAMTSSYSATCVSAEIGESCTSIGGKAFYNYNILTSVTIPNSVTSIGESTFNGCYGLTSIEIPNSVTSIGNYAFTSCSGITNIVIPNGVTVINIHTFNGCSSLTSITIPNSVTSIGNSVFSNCSGLTSIEIPNSVTSIGSYTFSNCVNLTSITIGSGVTTIDGNAFDTCSGLMSIISLATTAPTINSTTFVRVKTNGTLYVPIGSSGYNVWMYISNYYLGKYSWAKVEQ